MILDQIMYTLTQALVEFSFYKHMERDLTNIPNQWLCFHQILFGFMHSMVHHVSQFGYKAMWGLTIILAA